MSDYGPYHNPEKREAIVLVLQARVMELENEVAQLTGLLQAQSEEFHADLRVQGHQWSKYATGLEQERNNLLRENEVLRGQVHRQRETIEEQADKITELRDTVQELRDRVAHLEAYTDEELEERNPH